MTNPTPTRAEVEALADEIERKSLSEYAAMAVPMLRAYAATLAPQSAPVADGKPTPTPEMRCIANDLATICASEDQIANALATCAQKAALEADARLAEADAAHAWVVGMLDAKGKKVSDKITWKQLSDWRFEAIARHRARGAS